MPAAPRIGQAISTRAEEEYQQLREDLTAEVESVQFHQQKIEYLVDQLYAYNRRLTALETRLAKLDGGAESEG